MKLGILYTDDLAPPTVTNTCNVTVSINRMKELDLFKSYNVTAHWVNTVGSGESVSVPVFLPGGTYYST